MDRHRGHFRIHHQFTSSYESTCPTEACPRDVSIVRNLVKVSELRQKRNAGGVPLAIVILTYAMKSLTWLVLTWRDENSIVGSSSRRSDFRNLVAKHPPFPLIFTYMRLLFKGAQKITAKNEYRKVEWTRDSNTSWTAPHATHHAAHTRHTAARHSTTTHHVHEPRTDTHTKHSHSRAHFLGHTHIQSEFCSESQRKKSHKRGYTAGLTLTSASSSDWRRAWTDYGDSYCLHPLSTDTIAKRTGLG